MLVNYTLANYKSFKDAQSLSFVASIGDEFPKHTVTLENGLRINKIAAIIGGNGTGKTQLIDSLQQVSDAIINNKINELHHPYAFSSENRVNPSDFELIIIDSKKENFLRYGFSVFKGVITKEYLFVRPVKKGARESCIFEREGQELNFKKNEYKKHEYLIKPILKESGAVITFAKSLEIIELTEVFRWSYRQIAYQPEYNKEFGLKFIEGRLNDKLLSEKEDEKIVGENYVSSFMEEYNNYVKQFPLHIDSVEFLPTSDDGKYRFVYKIDNLDGGCTVVSPEKRSEFFSQGTLNVLAFLGVLLWAHKTGFSLYIDEIDSSIHYSLANSLIAMVINKVCQDESDNHQFIFSTHNIPLLDECIRRDELNIFVKDETKSTKIINASEYSVRKDSKISLKYFRGEFGVVPSFMERNNEA